MLEFPMAEYERRQVALKKGMAAHNLDIVILTSKENNRYFTGYQSIVWDSKVSTPGTIIFSSDGRMTFIGSHNARQTILTTSCMEDEDIITYSRNPDHQSPGSFTEALKVGLERHHFSQKRVGMEFGVGFRPHLSYPALQAITRLLENEAILGDAADMLWGIRCIKSAAELDLFTKVCEINSRLYDRAFKCITPGKTTEMDVYHEMGKAAFEEGCENILLMGIICGRDRESQANCPPSHRIIGSNFENEFLMIDGGPCLQGYYSDIIRMGYVGTVSKAQQAMYDFAVTCTNYAISLMKPGIRAGDVCDRVDQYIKGSPYALYNRTKGWIGHSIGLDIHEYPCLESGSNWEIQPGMCFSVEPALYKPDIGKFILEQNVVITENGCKIVSPISDQLESLG